ncbi:hypothetical protein AGMMS50293_22720 [Spirochaetia bacterium]|nr:hypothetical protein AGMMS50293_22720 [Spirochaetia bacterium]
MDGYSGKKAKNCLGWMGPEQRGGSANPGTTGAVKGGGSEGPEQHYAGVGGSVGGAFKNRETEAGDETGCRTLADNAVGKGRDGGCARGGSKAAAYPKQEE